MTNVILYSFLGFLLPLAFLILVILGFYRISQGHEDPMEPKTSPKDFFMQLFVFGTLYISALSLGSLLFTYIDRLFPDQLTYNYYGYYSTGLESVRWPIAMLIVLFPIFLILSRIINNDFVAHPEKKDSRVYKWLVYLTITIASATIIIDLVTLIYNFLGGDLATSFLLKIFVVLIISLAVFGYYMWHIKSDLGAVTGKRKLLIWASSLVILGSIIAGFFILGSPINQRNIRFDEQRVSDLQQIQGQIINEWQLRQKLPVTLLELDNTYIRNQLNDPQTKEAYGYKITGTMSFELCATFKTKGPITDNIRPNGYYGVPDFGDFNNWEHDSGYKCFPRTIDPQIYPKRSNY